MFKHLTLIKTEEGTIKWAKMVHHLHVYQYEWCGVQQERWQCSEVMQTLIFL